MKVAYRTQGNVKDVAVVLEATDSYRQEQDVYLEFNNLFIQQKPSPSGKGLKFRDIMDRFKDWFTKTYNNRTMPNGKDVQSTSIIDMVNATTNLNGQILALNSK